jgi:C1A family cysteine protease
MTLYKVDDWGFADGNGGNGVAPTTAIKAAIMAYGCVGSAIAADNAFMNVKPGQVFKGNSRDINHDIILVGWDDAKGAWILRNSWGTGWCDGGYCWIAYGANSVGTEAVWCVVHNANPPINFSSF